MTIYTVVRKPTRLNSTVALGTADFVHQEGVLSVYSFILVLDKPSVASASTVVLPLVASSTVTVESVHTVSVPIPPLSYIDVELWMNGELLDSTTSDFELVVPGAVSESEAVGESQATESVALGATPEGEATCESVAVESVTLDATAEPEAVGESVVVESVVLNATPEGEAVSEATVSESVSTE